MLWSFKLKNFFSKADDVHTATDISSNFNEAFHSNSKKIVFENQCKVLVFIDGTVIV